MGCFKWMRKCTSKVAASQLSHSGASAAATPPWPPGTGFGTGTISLGEIEVCEVSTFTQVWCTHEGGIGDKGATFCKPTNLPACFSCLGYFSQSNNEPFGGSVLVVREKASNIKVTSEGTEAKNQPSRCTSDPEHLPALARPVDFTCVWTSEFWEGKQTGVGCFWLPSAPEGYKALGFVVTNTKDKPDDDKIMCVRADLTDQCAAEGLVWTVDPFYQQFPFSCWTLKPLVVGVDAQGVSIGTFYCTNALNPEKYIPISILKNADFQLQAMPNLDQINALVTNYGPTVYFHPDEEYFPASVQWFFKQGALLYESGSDSPVKIAVDGSNLPFGGTNDGKYWIDLPKGNSANNLKKGNLKNAITYVHVKPMFGGIFTDLVFWLYYPFNGPCIAKVGIINVALGRIGEHVSDWEHFTLRVSNFTGELLQVYFSEHSSGLWVGASELEYLNRRPVVYSSKHGHSTYAHEGKHLQGDDKHGFGIRNDAARSKFILDTSIKFQIISAHYLNALSNVRVLSEPPWLQYMREWGPKLEYDARAELDRIVKFLPSKMRNSLEELFDRFPEALSGEEGPTGPKEKDNWDGDERC